MDPTNNRFTIYLTANAAASVKVAWLVMGSAGVAQGRMTSRLAR